MVGVGDLVLESESGGIAGDLLASDASLSLVGDDHGLSVGDRVSFDVVVYAPGWLYASLPDFPTTLDDAIARGIELRDDFRRNSAGQPGPLRLQVRDFVATHELIENDQLDFEQRWTFYADVVAQTPQSLGALAIPTSDVYGAGTVGGSKGWLTVAVVAVAFVAFAAFGGGYFIDRWKASPKAIEDEALAELARAEAFSKAGSAAVLLGLGLLSWLLLRLSSKRG